MPPKLRAFLLACAAVLLLSSCGGNQSSSASPPDTALAATSAAPEAASPAPSSTATLPRRGDPDAARAMQHLRTLAGDIGSRPATSDAERRAADYIRGQLEAAGYQTSLEEFDVQATLGGSATLRLPDGSTVDTSPLTGTPNGTVEGQLAAAGLGSPSDFTAAPVSGRIAVLDRGEVTFAEKARNAEQAGAVGVIVVNNEPGLFRGALGNDAIHIPVVGVAREARPALDQARSAGGPVHIEVATDRVDGTSQNVVGKPSEQPCTAYLGAHYDSVPAGPGANDNASGTSMLLEVARARRIDGLCVIAFGAEEVGLFGSMAYVRDHDVGTAAFMINFDMVGKMTSPTFIGDDALTSQAARIASGQGTDVRTAGSFGPGTSSDHASFQQAGVPVLMFYSGDDEFIHTARDNLDNVSQDDMAKFLDTAIAVIDQLLAA